jgi:orotate phosphoribosyltransferase
VQCIHKVANFIQLLIAYKKMLDYQHKFIKLAIEQQALSFGKFTLKSGRISPYFFNTGKFNTASSLATLADCYAQTLHNTGWEFDMLLGLAYKGIPLVSATALLMHQKYERDIPYAFNRKQVKTYGDTGVIVGAPLAGKIVLVDDVITAGTAVTDILPSIEGSGAQIAGVLVALDRQETFPATSPVVTQNIPVASIISIDNILKYLGKMHSLDQNIIEELSNYRQQYGVEK